MKNTYADRFLRALYSNADDGYLEDYYKFVSFE